MKKFRQKCGNITKLRKKYYEKPRQLKKRQTRLKTNK